MNSKTAWRLLAAAAGLLLAAGCGPSGTHSAGSRLPTPAASSRAPASGQSGYRAGASGGSVLAGAKLYASTCQRCHGKGGVGTTAAPRLAAPSSVVSRFSTKTALEAFIAHNMPPTNPGSLTGSQATDAADYVWRLAGGH